MTQFLKQAYFLDHSLLITNTILLGTQKKTKPVNVGGFSFSWQCLTWHASSKVKNEKYLSYVYGQMVECFSNCKCFGCLQNCLWIYCYWLYTIRRSVSYSNSDVRSTICSYFMKHIQLHVMYNHILFQLYRNYLPTVTVN